MQTTQITVETRANGVVIWSFTNIRPVNNMKEGIEQGHFAGHNSLLINRGLCWSAEGEKTLYLVYFNRTVRETEYPELLRKEGKQPCRNCPNYLLGLMVQTPENQMPDGLRHKDIVAAEPDNTSSVFTDENDSYCFLYAVRDDAGRRLDLADVRRGWCDNSAFLAEDLPPEGKTA